MLWLGMFLWWGIGFTVYLFWHAARMAYTTADIPLSIYAGIVGPVAFLMFPPFRFTNKVLIKKRDSKTK